MHMIPLILIPTISLLYPASPDSEVLKWAKKFPKKILEKEAELGRLVDYIIDANGALYIIQKGHPGVVVIGVDGAKIGEIYKKGRRFLNPTSIDNIPGGFVVTDSETDSLYLFKDGQYSKSVDLSQKLTPYSVAVVGDRIYCAGHGVDSQSGGILILDLNGSIVDQVIPDIESASYTGSDKGLWERAALFPLPKKQILVGYHFLTQAFILDRRGELIAGADMSSFYQHYERVSDGMVLPDGYAATSYCALPNKGILVSACTNSPKKCGRLMLFNDTLQEKIAEVDLGRHIWKIKYHEQHRMIGLMGGGSLYLYDVSEVMSK